MQASGRYFDGLVAQSHAVLFTLEGTNTLGTWVITAAESGRVLGRWPATSLFEVTSRKQQLRLGSETGPHTARITFDGWETVSKLRAQLPILKERGRAQAWRQTRLISFATLALAGIAGAYVYGVPILAGPIAAAIPPDWESAVGDSVAEQIEAGLAGPQGWIECGTGPDSQANKAIARFANAVVADADTPFKIEVTVAQSEVPNAFAIPGGRIYYLSALLEKTKSADEFSGVLAHEIGHVVHRHAMEQLVSSAGTGLLIGFVLGDMTGLSIAGGLGAAVIDSHNSRNAERQADEFAAASATRLNFDPTALADLLDRIAEDDEFTTALSLLSSHPLTRERRLTLASLAPPDGSSQPAFTDAEWQAISTMCGHGSAAPRVSGSAGARRAAGGDKKR